MVLHAIPGRAFAFEYNICQLMLPIPYSQASPHEADETVRRLLGDIKSSCTTLLASYLRYHLSVSTVFIDGKKQRWNACQASAAAERRARCAVR
eukprot:6190595-Pleurochrysis_carterae.AAC.1